MKKIVFILSIMMLSLLTLVSCELPNSNKYKLEVIDDFGYLLKPLDKYYEAGEEVDIHLKFLSGPSVGINLNGEYIGENADTKHEDGHPVLTFNMPNKDSILYTTSNGYILKECKSEDVHEYEEITLDVMPPKIVYICKLCGHRKDSPIVTIEQLIIEAYIQKYNPKDEFDLEKIHTITQKDGKQIAAFMMDTFAEDALGTETVDGINFYYRDSRRIEVFYDNNIYSLQEAFDNDLLTRQDLINIAIVQNENCKLGHSWDEGKLTQVPGGGEDMLYTCLVCGETTSERVNNGNVYSLTLTGAVEYVIEDITGEYAENSLIMISTQTLIDADIEVYVNGVKAEKDKTSNHEGTELFMFSMPSEDAVVEIKVVTSKYFTVTLHDLDDYQWVNELDKNDIIKVKYESSAIGIAPGNLINIVYSTDPEDISKLYDSIILAQYVETDMEYAVMDGGGYRKYEFITNDKTYSIYLSNGFVTSQQNHPSADVTELKYYKFLGKYYTFTSPSLECNSFLVYNDTYQVYNAEDDTLIGEYEGLDEFEFAPYEGPLVEWLTPYYIETQFGRVYIHTKDIIYLKDGNTFTYFQIVGDKDFSFLFTN